MAERKLPPPMVTLAVRRLPKELTVLLKGSERTRLVRLPLPELQHLSPV